MSQVILLAADRPLPLHEPTTRRIRTVRSGRETIPVEEEGFSVRAHAYYRGAVEGLGLEMKPYQYELDVAPAREEAALLRDYLAARCRPGEQVELWNLWVGPDRAKKVPSFRGRLADLDEQALAQLCDPPLQNGRPGQCRLTVTI